MRIEEPIYRAKTLHRELGRKIREAEAVTTEDSEVLMAEEVSQHGRQHHQARFLAAAIG